MATLLVVSAARAGRADDAGAAEYGMGMWLVGKGRMVERWSAELDGMSQASDSFEQPRSRT